MQDSLPLMKQNSIALLRVVQAWNVNEINSFNINNRLIFFIKVKWR